VPMFLKAVKGSFSLWSHVKMKQLPAGHDFSLLLTVWVDYYYDMVLLP
jgi:hypothetical protein